MQAKTVTSFPLIEAKHQPYNKKISVLSAINRLKQTEHKVLETRKREIVQQRIKETILARQEQNKKKEMFKNEVRKSLQMDIGMKLKSMQRREKQIQKLHEIASTLRETKFQFKETLRSTQKEEKTKIYESAVTQRQRNEKRIQKFKKRQMQQKISNRKKIAELQEKSRQKVKQFHESRVISIKQQREKDVDELERKIMAKSRYLERLGDGKSNGDSVIPSRSGYESRSKSMMENVESRGTGSDGKSEGKQEKVEEKQRIEKVDGNKIAEGNPSAKMDSFALTNPQIEAKVDSKEENNKEEISK